MDRTYVAVYRKKSGFVQVEKFSFMPSEGAVHTEPFSMGLSKNMPVSITKDCIIKNKLGLHARAAARFVKTACCYPCTIWLSRGDEEVDGKSILDILTLACLKGTQVQIKAQGEQASEAVEALVKLINDKFGEE